MAEASPLNTTSNDRQKLLGVGSQLGELIRKSTVNRGKVVTQIKVTVISIGELLRIQSHLPLPGTARETHLRTEMSLTSLTPVNLSYKRVAAPEFPERRLLAVS